jgi:hypothetical protein
MIYMLPKVFEEGIVVSGLLRESGFESWTQDWVKARIRLQ